MLKTYHFHLASLFLCLIVLTGCGQSNGGMQANAATIQSLPAGKTNNNEAPNTYSDIQILSQPESWSVSENEPFTLLVEAHSELPLTFQWYKNNEPIPGATEAYFSIEQSTLADNGFYYAVISNAETEKQSLTANISIASENGSFSIVQALQGQTIPAGDPLYLSVEVEGQGPFYYQWQKNGSVIPNSTGPVYYVAETQKSDAASYRVIISNGIKTLYSNFAEVWITDKIDPITILNHPQSQLLPESSTTVLSVSASGGGFITYQWRKNGEPIANAFSASLSLSDVHAEDTGYYDVVVANSQGSKVSNPAYLEILSTEQTIQIKQQPLSQFITLGQGFSLSVSTVSEHPVQYQWFHNAEMIPGANAASYHVMQADLEDAGNYSVLVSDASSSLRSMPALISFYDPGMYAIELSWDTPRTREDGSPLASDEILEYVIEYGYQDDLINQQITVPHQTDNRYVLDGVNPGTLLLRIATVDIDGHQGHFSDIISLSID